MSIVVGQYIGKRLLAAWGLEHQLVRRIDLHIAVNEAVTVTIERLADKTESDDVLPILEQYHLVRRDDDSISDHPSTLEQQPNARQSADGSARETDPAARD